MQDIFLEYSRELHRNKETPENIKKMAVIEQNETPDGEFNIAPKVGLTCV